MEFLGTELREMTDSSKTIIYLRIRRFVLGFEFRGKIHSLSCISRVYI